MERDGRDFGALEDGTGRALCADLARARREIRRPDCTVAAVLDGRLLAAAGGAGVGPLVRVMEQLPESVRQVSVADRIIGAAAALFLRPPQVAGVYADVMSAPGRKHLEECGVLVRFAREVPAILNRAGDDLCPMEKMAVEGDPETVRRRIRGMVADS